MGYTASFWATRPGDVLGALAVAHPEPPSVPLTEATRANWAELGRVVADLLRRGGGRLVAEYAEYVAGVIHAVGFHYGSLDHTSSGGEEFRRRFLAGPAAARYGREAVADLFARDLGGLLWEEYPRLGHVTAPEVGAVAARLGGPPQSDHPEDIGPLLVLDGAFGRAARFGLELHTVYG